LFNQKVVGWSMINNLTTESTIISAWHMVVKPNVVTEMFIFYSDRGYQYASYIFTNISESYDSFVKQSMSRKGNFWDNAVAESLFKNLKTERVYKHKYNYRSQV